MASEEMYANLIVFGEQKGLTRDEVIHIVDSLMYRKNGVIALDARTSAPEKWSHPFEQYAAQKKKIQELSRHELITMEEAEAVLQRLGFRWAKKNILLALQVMNRYAAEKGIRPCDAEEVFKQYL
jgi:hypothetical protein